jgi:hypothetical protein
MKLAQRQLYDDVDNDVDNDVNHKTFLVLNRK